MRGHRTPKVEKVAPVAENPLQLSDIVDFSLLRNEFTGGHATAVDTPSPGNFRYARLEPGKMVLEVYGEGGRILKQYIYPNPVTIGPPGPGELVTVPPKKFAKKLP